MANRDGAVVVWRDDLYQREALRQLFDTSFYAKVDYDLTFINQDIVKTILELDKNCQPLQKILPSLLLELRVFTFNLKSTNLTTLVDPSFLPAVVPPNLFPAI